MFQDIASVELSTIYSIVKVFLTVIKLYYNVLINWHCIKLSSKAVKLYVDEPLIEINSNVTKIKEKSL